VEEGRYEVNFSTLERGVKVNRRAVSWWTRKSKYEYRAQSKNGLYLPPSTTSAYLLQPNYIQCNI
jgi:hypothetical protein